MSLSASFRSMMTETYWIQRRPGDFDEQRRPTDRYGNQTDLYEDVAACAGRREPLDPKQAEPFVTGGDNASKAMYRIFVEPGETIRRTDRLVEKNDDGTIARWYSIHFVDLVTDASGIDHHYELVASRTS